MESLVGEYGLLALFVLSFAAATVAPVGSEWLLALMLLQGGNPINTVAVASMGNFLGACTTYGLGLLGRGWLEKRGTFEQKNYIKAENLFLKHGTPTLLLTWLPIIGDAICLAAGVFRVAPIRFSIYTFTGKAARYAVVALAVA